MRIKFPIVLMMSLLSIAVLSCSEKDKKGKIAPQEEEKTVLKTDDSVFVAGEEWNLVWADEFDKDSIDTNNWNYQVVEAGRFNDEWQRYTNSTDNAYIEDDCLVIKAIHMSDEHGMNQYTSARIHTANKQSWKYGKIVARIKLPQGMGIWPAFWMLGANIDENGGDTPWPQSGEIDILELYGSKDAGVVEGNLHYADQTDSHKMSGAVPFKLEQGIFADSFHVFELVWNPDKIEWFVDGKRFSSVSIAADELSEFHKDFFILLNLAVGGAHAGRPDATTVFPQYMYIDWVRVYQK